MVKTALYILLISSSLIIGRAAYLNRRLNSNGKMSMNSLPNILIATGDSSSGHIKSEIINLNSDYLTCSDFDDYPLDIEGAVGGTLNSSPVICGGYSFNTNLPTDKCYAIIDGKWQEFATMTEPRAYAAAIVYQESLHIFGGFSGENYWSSALKSSEIIHADGTVTVSVDLPNAFAKNERGIAFVNETVSILTGFYEKTWYYNHVNMEFQMGPDMSQYRSWHAIGTLLDRETDQNIPVVAGGIGAYFPYTSYEMLINGQWQKGYAPRMMKHTMVSFNGELYAIGGEQVSADLGIYKLSCKDCEWTPISQNLKQYRPNAVAIPVLDSLVDCTVEK